MKTRALTQDETEKVDGIINLGIDYELLYLTDTGLNKGILDATAPVVELLKRKGVHDYESQEQGQEHKVMYPCILLTEGMHEEVKVSLYRSNTRGDTRLWPSRFSSFASPNSIFALFVGEDAIVLVNLSDGQPLNSTEFIGIGDFERETEIEQAASREIDEPSRFEVSSYGWDSDVEGLVKRLNRGDIKLPGFQRGFVWSTTDQSRFIESLILGLPVPNIFLAKDGNSKILNIIDGQQRLKTLQRYLGGEFPISNSKKIHEDLRGCYFSRDVAKSDRSKVLDDTDARTLGDSILHSIVIRPDPSTDSPDYGHEYNDAVIQIFRRLNTSGKALQPQEVRSCIFYGSFDDLIHDLNISESWRSLFGPVHSRCKDVEAILRFLALYESYHAYRAPMPSFLDKYMGENRNMDAGKMLELDKLFQRTTGLLLQACGKSLFRTSGTFLLAKFDAVTVGLARALASGIDFEHSEIRGKVEKLMGDSTYISSTAEFINDTGNVIDRIDTAVSVFEG